MFDDDKQLKDRYYTTLYLNRTIITQLTNVNAYENQNHCSLFIKKKLPILQFVSNYRTPDVLYMHSSIHKIVQRITIYT